ncbi:hypothetical protein J6590_065958 [Homalodisca vitripennis]|nr:hypothetical protein J6590_065958 [Homalodisca vitripennis]
MTWIVQCGATRADRLTLTEFRANQSAVVSGSTNSKPVVTGSARHWLVGINYNRLRGRVVTLGLRPLRTRTPSCPVYTATNNINAGE